MIATAAFFVAIMILYVLFILFALVFWIWMLCDCLFHNWQNKKRKIIWTLIIFFGGFIGALLFYALIKSKAK